MGGLRDPAHLHLDVDLAHPVESRVGVVDGVEHDLVLSVQHGDRLQPVIEHCAALCHQGRAERAAAIVPANDDVFDLQMLDGILKHRRMFHVAGVDHIGDVAVDEHLAGIKAEHVIAVIRLSEQPIQR